MRIRGKDTVIVMIILVIALPLSIYFPVHQAAVYREIGFETAQIERKMKDLSEKNRKLVGELTMLQNPDRIVNQAQQVFGEEKASEDDVIIIKER